MSDLPRVVITGMGAVTPLGNNLSQSWQRLLQGDCAQGPVTLFDVSGCRSQQGAQAEIPELNRPSPQTRRFSRATLLAIPAVEEALQQADLLEATGASKIKDLTLSLSTTAGGMSWGEKFFRNALQGKKRNQLRFVAAYQPQQQVLDLQKYFSFTGSSFAIANACASGANAIGHAFDLIQAGQADCVLAGGFEALTELVYVGFDRLQAATTDRCRPFDETRSGLILGEASAFLVLETFEHAHARGAKILAELVGYGHATDTFHLTQPEPTGKSLVAAMEAALRRADLKPEDIGYVNAHGTATMINDGTEAAAYEKVFSGFSSPVKISSTKAAIGHTLGAAGAIEALFSILALREKMVPPQINLRQPLPNIASALAQPGDTIKDGAKTMSVNLGFGGSNAALIFASHEN